MLAELRIKNFTILSDLRIDFTKGLNLLTGETGAGKSIIVDALSMFIIPRAPIDYIKNGAKEAQVEALFYEIAPSLTNLLSEELSIDVNDGLILRRIISSQGRTRAYINDSPVSIQTLTKIGSSLIAIQGQHEHQHLLKGDAHRNLLDSYGSLERTLKDFSALYGQAKECQKELQELRNGIRERAQREEFLTFQIKEITEADPKAGELEELTSEFNRLSNAARLRELAEEAYALLYQADNAVLERLQRAATALKNIENFDKGVSEIASLIDSAIAVTEDAAGLLRSRKDYYEANPVRMEQAADRIDTLKRLLKKYGDTLDEVLRYKENAEAEMERLRSKVVNQESLEREFAALQIELKAKATTLSQQRQHSALDLEKNLLRELENLGFKNASFKVELKPSNDISEKGIEDVEFLFSANPGEPLKPLHRIASGGELSRIMLALKTATLKNKKSQGDENYNEPATLIFDEVDAGIGGITANHVGRKLRAISKAYQTICITHLPQIAALADHHLIIEKTSTDSSYRVSVRALDIAQRKIEIARMLSGTITESSLNHAEELLLSKAGQ